MRPSDITDGIKWRARALSEETIDASMRPSDITDGILNSGTFKFKFERLQ